VENIGSGDADQERSDKAATVANSTRSTRPGKRSTTKTARLTLEQALEILQQSLLEFEHAGGNVLAIGNVPNAGNVFIVAINGVLYCQHCHHLSLGSICQHCAGNEANDAG